jgi:hypothetical protein
LTGKLTEQRINVNCIAPGYIKLESGTSPKPSDFETALIKNTPWGRLGTPADIAPPALFLASPAADYVTGEVLAGNEGGLCRAHVPAAQHPEGALIDDRLNIAGGEGSGSPDCGSQRCYLSSSSLLAGPSAPSGAITCAVFDPAPRASKGNSQQVCESLAKPAAVLEHAFEPLMRDVEQLRELATA